MDLFLAEANKPSVSTGMPVLGQRKTTYILTDFNPMTHTAGVLPSHLSCFGRRCTHIVKTPLTRWHIYPSLGASRASLIGMCFPCLFSSHLPPVSPYFGICLRRWTPPPESTMSHLDNSLSNASAAAAGSASSRPLSPPRSLNALLKQCLSFLISAFITLSTFGRIHGTSAARAHTHTHTGEKMTQMNRGPSTEHTYCGQYGCKKKEKNVGSTTKSEGRLEKGGSRLGLLKLAYIGLLLSTTTLPPWCRPVYCTHQRRFEGLSDMTSEFHRSVFITSRPFPPRLTYHLVRE